VAKKKKGKAWPSSEQELAETIVKYVEDQGWEVYHEVQGRYGMSVADIVAIKDGKSWIIEIKRSFGLAVLEQAYEWRKSADFVSIAFPRKRAPWKKMMSNFAKKIISDHNMGVIVAQYDEYPAYLRRKAGELRIEVKEHVKPQQNEVNSTLDISKVLTEHHKTFAKAGSRDGGHYTPFRLTRKRLVEAVSKDPGKTLKEYIAEIDHHYASAKSAQGALSKLIKQDVITELYFRKSGNKKLVYLTKK
jgi:hypothetical protein